MVIGFFRNLFISSLDIGLKLDIGSQMKMNRPVHLHHNRVWDSNGVTQFENAMIVK